VSAVTEFPFEDHHFFTEEEIDTVIKKYQTISHFNKLILTTEKDAVRLEKFKEKLEGVEIFILPMKIHFFEEDKFLAYLKNFLLEFKI
jgi:tetraacyldisaccharide 4'-kinase